MEFRVEDKVALVTGASRGIGLGIAGGLLGAGARGVVITSRKPDNLQAAVAELGSTDRVLAVEGKADDDAHAAGAVTAAIETFGALDILVNNAATNPVGGNLVDVDMGAVDKIWAVNQRAPLVFSREAWSQWMREHGGTIVNVASVGGMQPGPLLGAYNVSKAALIFMTRQLAFELAPKVRVNAIAPGIVRTRFSRALWESNEAHAAELHPLGRLGEVSDVTGAVVFLCSDGAAWITGVTLPIDGGAIGASPGLG
jgi:NAD(P)-dependent dehydrogenase (short-subunit alcohol dehydrogenase family)